MSHKISTLVFFIVFIEIGEFNYSLVNIYGTREVNASIVSRSPGANQNTSTEENFIEKIHFNHTENEEVINQTAGNLSDPILSKNNQSSAKSMNSIDNEIVSNQSSTQLSSSYTCNRTTGDKNTTLFSGSTEKNETIDNESSIQNSNMGLGLITSEPIEDQNFTQLSITSTTNSLSAQSTGEPLTDWKTITPGFFAESICVVRRGWWRSNLKLSPNETWINKKKCSVSYCFPDGTLRSYT